MKNMKEYSSKAAAELAALTSIQRDLGFTLRACDLLLGPFATEPNTPTPNPPGEPETIRESLWNAALIAYARCFATGVREHRLDESDYESVPEHASKLKADHKYFIDLRSKHIAHSVNRLEEVRVAVAVPEKGVLGVGPFHIWQSEQEFQNVRLFRAMAGVLLEQVNRRIAEKGKQVLEEVNKLDKGQLDALPDCAFQLPVEIGEVSVRR